MTTDVINVSFFKVANLHFCFGGGFWVSLKYLALHQVSNNIIITFDCDKAFFSFHNVFKLVNSNFLCFSCKRLLPWWRCSYNQIYVWEFRSGTTKEKSFCYVLCPMVSLQFFFFLITNNISGVVTVKDFTQHGNN